MTLIQQSQLPSLRNLVEVEYLEKIPWLQEWLEGVLEDVFYFGYNQSHLRDGAFKQYDLTLVLYKEFGFTVISPDFKLLVNPGSAIGQVEIPISLTTHWPIKRFFKQLSIAELSDLNNCFKLIFEIFNLVESDLLSSCLYEFHQSESSQFVNSYNLTSIGLSYPIDVLALSSDEESNFHYILEHFDTNEIDILSYILSEEISVTNDIEASFERLFQLFTSIVGPFTLEDLIALFIPKISVEFQSLQLALEFPTDWLKPVSPDPVDEKSRLIYNAGSLLFHTEKGIDFNGVDTFELTESYIANTPLTISIANAKFDLRTDKNIPEADADGRPETFKGIYIERAEIGFPNFLMPSNDSGDPNVNAVAIVTKNMLIGSEGGISGTIGVEKTIPAGDSELNLTFEIDYIPSLVPGEDPVPDITVVEGQIKIKGKKKIVNNDGEIETELKNELYNLPNSGHLHIIDSENNYVKLTHLGVIVPDAEAPSGLYEFKIGNTTIKINDFFITFNKNKIVSSTVTGLIDIPDFENDLILEIDFSDGFKALVYPDDEEGEVVINDPVELTLEELELGKAEEKLYVRFQGILKPKVKLPIIGKYIPEVLDINNLIWKESDGLDYEIDLIWKNGLKIGITNDGPPQLNEFKKEIPIHKNKEGGFFHLDAIDFVIKPNENEGITAGAYLRGAKFTFANAVTFALDQLGVEATVKDGGSGNANVGPFQVKYKLVEPKGIGVSIDAEAVTGSGYLYFDKDAGEYSGFISLKLKNLVSVTALGVLNTKMPDGEEGYSFAVLISATGLGIPLFADFILDGLGGMLGIHRTVDTDVIRSGLRNKTMDSILFPEVTKKNFTKVVTDFKSVYPVKRKQFLFGPMARITKGKDSSKTVIDLGFMVEFPNPLRLIILGDVNIGLGKKDDEVLKVNVAFLGEINLTEKRILFDASIYDSRLAKFTIEGDMAFRLFWGEQKGFIMTVGGFHPDYTPPQHLMVNDVRRIRISFLTDKDYHLFIDTYFAITSNTVQFGALADLKFKFKKFLIKGQLGFDTLFQFNPFRFSVAIQAYIGIFWGSTELLGIGFSGKLVGTSPWSINGKVTFKVLLVSFTARFNKTWGDEGNALLEAIDVETLVADELASDKNWKVIMPDSKNKLVGYTVSDPDGTSIYVHPLGSLSVEQSVAPMGINLEHFENHDISGARRFEINQMTIGSQVVTDFTPTYDDFAPAQFLKMSDKEKLASKSYELLKNGIQASGDSEQDFESFVTCSADYDKTILDVEDDISRHAFNVHNFLNHYQFVKGGRMQRSPLSKKNKIKKERVLEKAVSIPKSGFAIVDEDLNYYNNDGATYTLNTRAEAQNMINQLINSDPYLDGELSIVPEFELEA